MKQTIEIIYEPEDLDRSIFNLRNYILITKYFLKKCKSISENKIEKFDVLDYVVYIQYNVDENDKNLIHIFYKTTYIENYIYLLTINKINENKNTEVYNRKIRNHTHVLDEFYKQISEDEYNYLYRDRKDKDPLDGIADFKKHPKYLNGGFYYEMPYINDIIVNYEDLENLDIKKNITYVYDDVVYYPDENIKTIQNYILHNIIINKGISNTYIKGYLDLFNFYNKLIKSQFPSNWDYWRRPVKRSVKINKETFYYEVHLKRTYSRGETYYSYSIYFYNDEGTKELLAKSPYTTNGYFYVRSDEADDIFKTFMESKNIRLKIALYQDFLTTHYSTWGYKFVIFDYNIFLEFADNIGKYPVPKKYIDNFLILIDKNEEGLFSENIGYYIKLFNIIYMKSFNKFTKYLKPDLDYFLDYLTTINIPYDNRFIAFSFICFVNLFYPPNRTYSINHVKSEEMSMLSLHSAKIIFQRKDYNIIRYFLDACRYAGNLEVLSDNWYKLFIFNIFITKYNTPLYNNKIYPYTRNFIIKFGRIYRKRSYRSYKKSKYDIDLLNVCNILANFHMKENDDADAKQKSADIIRIVNYAIVHLYVGRNDGALKILAFFMLIVDKCYADVIHKLIVLMALVSSSRMLYPSICSSTLNQSFLGTTINVLLPKIWTHKVTPAHIDYLINYIKNKYKPAPGEKYMTTKQYSHVKYYYDSYIRAI